MKTLIFSGTPRKNGDTMSLINEVIEKLEGEYKLVHAYDCNIMACIDCRYCWQNQGCSIKDEMQDIYDYILECDNILIASPLYYSELTGPLLSVLSRLQTYFCAIHFRNEKPINKPKKGGIIIVGGGTGSIQKAYSTACIFLKQMNSNEIAPAVFCYNTNNIKATDDISAIEGARNLGNYFIV